MTQSLTAQKNILSKFEIISEVEIQYFADAIIAQQNLSTADNSRSRGY